MQGEACGGPDADLRLGQGRYALREPTYAAVDPASTPSSPDFAAILQVAVDAVGAEVGVLSLCNVGQPAGGALATSGPPDVLPTDLAAVSEPLLLDIGPHGLAWIGLPLMVRLGTPEAIILLGRRGGLPDHVSRASLAALSRVCALALRDKLSRRTTAPFDGLPGEDHRLREEEEFFVDISHELRTPAATIKTSAEVLEDLLGPELPVELRQLLQNIEREAERLGTLVDDLLDFNTIRRGHVRLHPVTCDLRQVAVQAVNSIEPLARRHSQTVRMVVPDTPVYAVIDPDLLVRAVLNLVSNAQKYGRHGGRLEVRLESSPSEAVFVVEDDGPGIPEADRERVFQRFYRSPTASGRRIQGSGLGLPLCRAAVELFGGRVWAEAGPSAGSVFKVALPLGRGSATPDVPG